VSVRERVERKKLGKNLSKWKLPHGPSREGRGEEKVLRSLCSMLNVMCVVQKILFQLRGSESRLCGEKKNLNFFRSLLMENSICDEKNREEKVAMKKVLISDI
jgi:hypothetical protein